MLVGGLGGLGRAIAIWMADRGAQTLIFISRSGQSKASSREIVQTLQERGVRVIVYACDIADAKQVQNIISELAQVAPPIRGVIQATMVMRVCPFPSPRHEHQSKVIDRLHRSPNARNLPPRPRPQIPRHPQPARHPRLPTSRLLPPPLLHQRPLRSSCLRRRFNLHGRLCSLPPYTKSPSRIARSRPDIKRGLSR